jgi:hypothetical protein
MLAVSLFLSLSVPNEQARKKNKQRIVGARPAAQVNTLPVDLVVSLAPNEERARMALRNDTPPETLQKNSRHLQAIRIADRSQYQTNVQAGTEDSEIPGAVACGLNWPIRWRPDIYRRLNDENYLDQFR